MTWIAFWKFLLVAALGAYALLALVVTWRGIGDVGAMLRALTRAPGQTEENE